MDVHKTIGHYHSHHGHKKHSSTLCSSIPKIWMTIQNILATDDRQAWKSLTQDADHIVHIKNALLMSRMSNDASFLPASSKHKVLQFEQPRRTEAQIRFGKTATDLNALQVAMFHKNEALACQIVSFLRLHADPRELTSFLNHVWGNKNTSLHLACFLAMPRLVKLLLELGANPATLNGRKLTAAECCKDSECLARLAVPPPQPMAPITIAKKYGPVAPASVARSSTTAAGMNSSSSDNNSNNNNNSKRSLHVSPPKSAERPATAPVAKPSAVTGTTDSASAVTVPAMASPARVTAGAASLVAAAAAPSPVKYAASTTTMSPGVSASTVSSISPLTQRSADVVATLPATTPSSVQLQSYPPEPTVPMVEEVPDISQQCSANSVPIIVNQCPPPKTLAGREPQMLQQSQMRSPQPFAFKSPLAPPPPPSSGRIHGANINDSSTIRADSIPAAAVRPQPQRHPTAPTPFAELMQAREVSAKGTMILAAVKSPYDSALFHIAAFHLRQIVKALEDPPPCRYPEDSARVCQWDAKTMAIRAVSHVYGEQAVSVP